MDDKLKEIHVTDLMSFCTCRQRWDWSSPLRRHLQPRWTPEPLYIGKAINIAMENGYRDSVGGPMKFNLDAALDGIEKWVSKRIEKEESRFGPLWDEEGERLNEMVDLIRNMITHYGLWTYYGKIDKGLTLLAVEHPFKVRIPYSYLYSVGKQDAVAIDDQGIYHVLEFKTARSLKQVSGTMRGLQPTVYLYALSQDPEFHSPLEKSVVEYRFLRKKAPQAPRVLQNGTLSKDKRIQTTSWWYIEKVLQTGQRVNNEFLDYLKQKRDSEFFARYYIHRKPIQVEHAMSALLRVGYEMANPFTPVFPIPGIHCSWCSFKEPCDLMEMGMFESCEDLLEAEYARREYWDEE